MIQAENLHFSYGKKEVRGTNWAMVRPGSGGGLRSTAA